MFTWLDYDLGVQEIKQLESNKLTVVGKVDPKKLRDYKEVKMQKMDLVSLIKKLGAITQKAYR